MFSFVGGSINFASVRITMQILEIFLGSKKNKTLPFVVSKCYRYQEQHKSIRLPVILLLQHGNELLVLRLMQISE
jgi:hypothetical protein